MGERERGRRQRPDKAEPELAPPIVHEALSAPGRPLDDETRAFMEPRFGHDFSRVRVHTDTRAAESAEAVSALAYTVGQDIVFGAGQYQPGTTEGRRLIAHELAHTVQQRTTTTSPGNVSSTIRLGSSDNSLEWSAKNNSLEDTVHAEGYPVQGVVAQPTLQRELATGTLISGTGLAISGANFAFSTRPSGPDSFDISNVQFRYSRDQEGPEAIREQRKLIFQLDSKKGIGRSFADIYLYLRFDGHNIITAYTYPERVEGYDGGLFGSEAAIKFSAEAYTHVKETVTGVVLNIQGFNNPSGFGSQRFRASIIVRGDGSVEFSECALTDGDGIAMRDPHCFVGWENRLIDVDRLSTR